MDENDLLGMDEQVDMPVVPETQVPSDMNGLQMEAVGEEELEESAASVDRGIRRDAPGKGHYEKLDKYAKTMNVVGRTPESMLKDLETLMDPGSGSKPKKKLLPKKEKDGVASLFAKGFADGAASELAKGYADGTKSIGTGIAGKISEEASKRLSNDRPHKSRSSDMRIGTGIAGKLMDEGLKALGKTAKEDPGLASLVDAAKKDAGLYDKSTAFGDVVRTQGLEFPGQGLSLGDLSSARSFGDLVSSYGTSGQGLISDGAESEASLDLG
ncbi:MAG: hypothetical protein HDQ88_12205 [Clostridia bacterium]|nr:hypothetical protein [Clostridia bacterium]